MPPGSGVPCAGFPSPLPVSGRSVGRGLDPAVDAPRQMPAVSGRPVGVRLVATFLGLCTRYPYL